MNVVYEKQTKTAHGTCQSHDARGTCQSHDARGTCQSHESILVKEENLHLHCVGFCDAEKDVVENLQVVFLFNLIEATGSALWCQNANNIQW